MPSKRAAYLHELAAWEANADLPPVYRPFLKSDEAFPRFGSGPAGKPRLIIEAFGRSVPVNAPLKIMASILKDLIPTFSSLSPLETAQRLEAEHV